VRGAGHIGFSRDQLTVAIITARNWSTERRLADEEPSTKTRVDLGLNLKGEPASGRLEASGSFNAMVSHRVRLESPADVDKQVSAWL
jgi:hypothetical protein